jgi:ribosomal subunit interface protein
MRVVVTGKQLDIGAALRGYVEEKLMAAVSKYFDNPIEGQVTISREGPMYRADLSAHVGAGMDVQSHGEGGDAYAGFETALERMDKRLRRYKRRLRDHHIHASRADLAETQAQSYVLAAEAEDGAETEDAPESAQPIVVAETRTMVPTVTVGDAVMRMDLADLPVLMLRNPASGEFNVVYRRTDGNIGWIGPEDGAVKGTTPN